MSNVIQHTIWNTHVDRVFGLQPIHVRVVSWWNIPNLDGGTNAVSGYKSEEAAKDISTVGQAKQFTYRRICSCYDSYADVVPNIDVIGMRRTTFFERMSV